MPAPQARAPTIYLRRDDLILPDHGRGKIILTAACPRTGTAWTSTGTPVNSAASSTAPTAPSVSSPIPPVLARMLLHHLHEHGTTPDRRLFRGACGGILGSELAATALICRPYDLRHAALSLWLNASGAPADVTARADNSA